MKHVMACAIALTLALAVASCDSTLPPRGQVAIHIDTDALVSPDDGPGLFDTLHVDVYDPGSTVPCQECGRTFTVTSEEFRALRVSFGVWPRPNTSGYRVRIRLYPVRASTTEEPPPLRRDGSPPTSVIETVVALPPVAEEGIVDGRVLLATDAVGVPVGTLSAPVALEQGTFSASKVDTWTGGQHVPCKTTPRGEEVCVPGGAFFMGDAHASRPPYNDDLRLVVLSPFLFSRSVATVAMFRMENFRPDRVAGGGNGSQPEDFCTFTDMPGPNEDLPVNCISFSTASDHCQNRGASLPTEAQYEYVASALRGFPFPWGSDPTVTCDDVVLGRIGYGVFAEVIGFCSPSMPIGGPLPVGSGKRDRVKLGGGDAVDLSGNMMSWMRDWWNRIDEPCWNHGGVFVDPVCDTKGTEPGHVAKGGGWFDAYPALATRRLFFPVSSSVTLQFGVRCTRPDNTN
jgi:formylglycine-generating enzyme required for sulfatase activity